MKLSIQASSYAGRVVVAMWTRITAGCSRGFEASLALFVVVSGLCLEAFLRARTAGAARAAPFLRKHAPMAADMLFESPKKNDDCEEALLLDLSPEAGYGATSARGPVDATPLPAPRWVRASPSSSIDTPSATPALRRLASQWVGATPESA